MPLEHWMMFSTFKEQDFFVYPRENAYAGVLINANMASYAPAGLASFIMGKLAPDTKYIIDPITHAFQHDPACVRNKDDDLKPSIKDLADAYGAPVSDCAGNRPLVTSDILPAHFDVLARRVLEFQRNHLSAHMAGSDYAKYVEEPVRRPYALIPPYFFLSETDWQGWLPINTAFLRTAAAMLAEGERLCAAVLVDRGALCDEGIRTAIIGEYAQLRSLLSGCLLWVDDFDEQLASVADLEAMKVFCSELKSCAPEVINSHGGYFSIMLGGDLGGCSLTGVAHAPEFGEFRSIVPVGGGIPIARYYVPQLHVRARYADAAGVFRAAGWLDSAASFHEHVCNCTECITALEGESANFTRFGAGEVKRVRRGRGMARIEFPFTDTKLRCLRHYLQRKHREFAMINKADPQQVLEEVQNSIETYRPYVGDGGVSHLRRWLAALRPPKAHA